MQYPRKAIDIRAGSKDNIHLSSPKYLNDSSYAIPYSFGARYLPSRYQMFLDFTPFRGNSDNGMKKFHSPNRKLKAAVRDWNPYESTATTRPERARTTIKQSRMALARRGCKTPQFGSWYDSSLGPTRPAYQKHAPCSDESTRKMMFLMGAGCNCIPDVCVRMEDTVAGNEERMHVEEK